MSTSLPKSKQWNLGKLALLPYDVDVSHNLSVAGAVSLAGGLRLPVTSVDAAGSSQTDATALSEGVNIVGAANDTKGVVLPTAVAGAIVFVKSTTASKILKVYPATGAAINALSANGAISLASGATPAIFVAASATQWYTFPLLPS